MYVILVVLITVIKNLKLTYKLTQIQLKIDIKPKMNKTKISLEN